MSKLFDILTTSDRANKIALDMQGKSMAPEFGQVTDPFTDPTGLRRLKASPDAKVGSTEGDFLMRVLPCPYWDPPMPQPRASVAMGFFGGNPHDGAFSGIMVNQQNPPFDKVDIQNDDWRLIPGIATLQVGANADTEIGNDRLLQIQGNDTQRVGFEVPRLSVPMPGGGEDAPVGNQAIEIAGDRTLTTGGKWDITTEQFSYHHTEWFFEEKYRYGILAELPEPSAEHRGKTLIVAVPGKPDKLMVCLKGTGEVYAWEELAAGPEGTDGGALSGALGGAISAAVPSAVAPVGGAATGGLGGMAVAAALGSNPAAIASSASALGALGGLSGGGALGQLAEQVAPVSNLTEVAALGGSLSQAGALGEMVGNLASLEELPALGELPGLGDLGEVAGLASGLDLGNLQSLGEQFGLGDRLSQLASQLGGVNLQGIMAAVQSGDLSAIAGLAQQFGVADLGELQAKLQEMQAIGQALGAGDPQAAIAALRANLPSS